MMTSSTQKTAAERAILPASDACSSLVWALILLVYFQTIQITLEKKFKTNIRVRWDSDNSCKIRG
jgi:hypothetical protein